MNKKQEKKIERKQYLTATGLNLLWPGLGHLYWRETLFGLFVFLVTLIAVILFASTFFIKISLGVKILMFSLPILFYAFSFLDLFRTMQKQNASAIAPRHRLIIFILAGLSFQILAPVAPGNFLIRNFPVVYQQPGNSLRPIFENGDWLKASRLEYTVRIAFINQPILHTLPGRYDLVCVDDGSGRYRSALLIGLPGEEIEVIEGMLLVNGFPGQDLRLRGVSLSPDQPLTVVDSYSIIVATLQMGNIDKLYQVPLENLVGKTDNLW